MLIKLLTPAIVSWSQEVLFEEKSSLGLTFYHKSWFAQFANDFAK